MSSLPLPSIAVSFFALAAPLTFLGCPTSTGLRNAAARPERDVLVPSQAAYRPPSRDELLREALAGTVTGEEDALDSRVQVRPLGLPHPPRGANAKFNFDGGRRGWITSLPSAELLTSPAFSEGRIYLGGGFASHHVFAFNAYSGELDWAVDAPDGGPSAAIIEDDAVIFNTESCTLFLYDKKTGAPLWSRTLGDPLMSQPAAGHGLVYSAYPSGGSHAFGAFRLSDGEPAWSVPIPADVIQAPQVSGDSVYFATMDGTAIRLAARTGREVWRRNIGASSALWVSGETVLAARRVGPAAHPREQIVVLEAASGTPQHEGESVDAPYLAGASRDRNMSAETAGAWGNVPSGEHLGLRNVAAGWAFQGSTPAVADGRAYFALGGEIRARDMASGRTVWTRAYRPAAGAQALSPPAVVGSQLVFGTIDGHLYSADIDTGMTLWAYDVGEPIVFQPIVAQGWVYVATGSGSLIGLEVGDPMFDGWHMWGGNARHSGLVETAGTVDPALLASLERPTRGTMRRAAFENAGGDASADPSAAEPQPISPATEPETSDLPLAHTIVHAQVSGAVARVTVTQEFHNPYAKPIEAVYMFPLPADAAVDDMEMHIGGRVVRARIQRRAQARQTYSEARASGRRAALLEQQRPNLFAQRVANIQPRERIDVQIQYVQMLPFERGEYEFAFPMVAPHRYDPAHPDPTAPAPDQLAPAAGQAPAVAAATPELRSSHEIDVSVEVDAGMPIERIVSPTHRIHVERPSLSQARLSLAASDRVPNRDLVIRYAVGGEVPRATVLPTRGADGAGYFGMLIEPPAAPADSTIAPRELLFVVDTSSSMSGRPMEHARAVIREALGALRPGDTFGILAFSDGIQELSAVPLRPTPEAIGRAGAFVDGLRAVGATAMVPAIHAALSRAPDSTRIRIVVLLTDGFIGNESDVLRAVANDLGSARLYSVGIGSSVNRFLLERAAEVGRGRSIVATLSERPEDAARRFASYVDRPVFTDVDIDWGGLDVRDVYPRHLPDLFADKPLVVSGRFGRGGRATVRVRGTVGGRRYERAILVTLPEGPSAENAVQRTLWARAAVHDRMSRITLRDDSALVEEVTELGLAHRMVTQYTSFVAVDETPAQPAAAANEHQADVEARATLSPARSLPGDPEIRIPAPRDARAVTIVLPFGETIAAAWEPGLGMWTARFLIPADAEDGPYPVEVLVTHAGGRQEHLHLWYVVDSAAPLVRMEVLGAARPGAEVTVRARQILSAVDLEMAGLDRQTQLTPGRALILSDARRVEVQQIDGSIVNLGSIEGEPGVWEGRLRIPGDARGTVRLRVVVVDLAANVRHQELDIQVAP